MMVDKETVERLTKDIIDFIQEPDDEHALSKMHLLIERLLIAKSDHRDRLEHEPNAADAVGQ